MSMDFLAFFDNFKITGTGKHAHPRADADDRDSMHRSQLPSRQLNALRDFVNNEWDGLDDGDGLTFLWDKRIGEMSAHHDRTSIEDAPVAPAQEAHEVMTKPIEWYFRSLANIIPTTKRTERGLEIPNADMPTYHNSSHVLSGVESVVANAVASNHWLEAAENLTGALSITSVFLGNAADRDNEGFSFINQLTQQIRVYYDSLARNADPTTAGRALAALTDAICTEHFMLNPIQMVEALACTLSFARWDDTRVLAYEAISRADAAISSFTHSLQQDNRDEANARLHADIYPLSELIGNDHASELRRHYNRLMLFLRHDLLRLSHDDKAADAFLNEHLDMVPFPDVIAAQMIHAERWESLLNFCDKVLRIDPNQPMMLFTTEVAPYGWDSLREAALESLGRVGELQDMYCERIIEAYDADEVYNVDCLRAISPDDWPQQVQRIIEAYADGSERFTRNPAYEHLLISERLGEEAYRYSEQFTNARPKLAKIIATTQPDVARSIILGPVDVDGSYHGELPMEREAYKRIARSLNTYASVFTVAEAQEIASRLVEHYPTRRQLARALHAFLE